VAELPSIDPNAGKKRTEQLEWWLAAGKVRDELNALQRELNVQIGRESTRGEADIDIRTWQPVAGCQRLEG
jgi:hypothetical protein